MLRTIQHGMATPSSPQVSLWFESHGQSFFFTHYQTSWGSIRLQRKKEKKKKEHFVSVRALKRRFLLFLLSHNLCPPVREQRSGKLRDNPNYWCNAMFCCHAMLSGDWEKCWMQQNFYFPSFPKKWKEQNMFPVHFEGKANKTTWLTKKEALAAVTVPWGLINAGFSLAICPGVETRIPLSAVTVSVRPKTKTIAYKIYPFLWVLERDFLF